MPTVVVWLVRAIGAAVAAKLLVKEFHRVNAELDAARAGSAAERAAERRNLRRDPDSGVYRPQ
jgi:hypothetical protein